MGLSLAWPVPGRFLANVSILGNVRICQVGSFSDVTLTLYGPTGHDCSIVCGARTAGPLSTALPNYVIHQVASMMLVFLITGLQLNTTEMKQALALRNLPVVVYGFVAILVITPCLGFALRAVPLHPWEFASGALHRAGFAVFHLIQTNFYPAWFLVCS